MHGPGFSYYSPEFPRPIPVEDGVVGTLRFRRKRLWREARGNALAMWEPAGIRFVVNEVSPHTFYGLGEPDWPSAGSEQASFAVPGRITLVRSVYTPESPKWWPFAWSYGYASFYNVPRLLRQPEAPTNQLHRVLCHEIGHNLGLAHGGNGIMSGGIAPNQHDLDSVKDYYAD